MDLFGIIILVFTENAANSSLLAHRQAGIAQTAAASAAVAHNPCRFEAYPDPQARGLPA